MSTDKNECIYVGEIASQVVYRSDPSRKPMSTFSIVTKFEWHADGETKSRATYHRLVAFGELAVRCRGLEKGNRVYVDAAHNVRKLPATETHDERYIDEFVIRDIQLLADIKAPPPPQPAPAPPKAPRPSRPTSPQQAPGAYVGEDLLEFNPDDYPFVGSHQ